MDRDDPREAVAAIALVELRAEGTAIQDEVREASLTLESVVLEEPDAEQRVQSAFRQLATSCGRRERSVIES